MSEPIEIVAYDHNWPVRYELERPLIVGALGAELRDVQHIGSTAVRGLGAKPVIDILAAVDWLGPAAAYRERLEPLGYQHRSHAEDADRLFFWKGSPEAFHVHVVTYGSWTYRRHLLFRDYLLAHPAVAQQYERLKRELAAEAGTNRDRYAASTIEFVDSIVARALATAHGSDHA
ncbi:MAG: GrpB family protein [Chloroflexi bacterium]|nr:GrpB family protein [Chloroflexota bacterium]